MAGSIIFDDDKIASAFNSVSTSDSRTRVVDFLSWGRKRPKHIQRLMILGDWASAISLLRTRIQQDGARPALMVLLAEAYLGKGDASKALAVFREAVTAHINLGQTEVAMELLHRIGRLMPSEPWPREKRVKLLLEAGESLPADVLKANQDEALLELYHLAEQAHARGNDVACCRYYRRICEIKPTDFDSLQAVVDGYMNDGMENEAVSFLTITARKLLAGAEYSLAERAIMNALQIRENDPALKALYFLVQVRECAGNGGLLGLERLYRQHPENLDVLRTLVEAEVFLGRLEAASKWLINAYKQNRSEAMAMLTLGRRLLADGKVGHAYELYRIMADDSVRNDRLDGALDLMRSILRVDGNHAPTLRWLARVCLAKGYANQASYYFHCIVNNDIASNRIQECRRFLEACMRDVGETSLLQNCFDRLDEWRIAG